MNLREILKQNYPDARSCKRARNVAFVALIYASILIAALSFHLSIYIRGHYGAIVYQVWVFFYFFTFQTNITIAIWLFCYAMITFTGSNSRFARFIRHPLLISSFTLYVSILFIYAGSFVLPNLIQDGFNATRNGFAIFTYLLTPIAVWIIFLTNNNHLYPKRKKIKGTKNHKPPKILGSYHSRKTIHRISKQPKALRHRDIVWFLVYPTLYFGLNTILGHTLIKAKERIYEDGTWTVIYGRAFAYPQLDPHFWPNVGIYIVFILAITFFFTSISVLIVSIKKTQYHRIRKYALESKKEMLDKTSKNQLN